VVRRLIIPLILLFTCCFRHNDALYIFFSSPWHNLSPYGTPLPPEYQARFTLYESLVWVKVNEYIPALAKSWVTIDDTTWVFHLVTNALFHDGTRFTAGDVVYSFKNYMEKNPDEKRNFYIKSIVPLDSFTVKFILHRNNPLFLPMVSSVPIVSKTLEGTGPYFLYSAKTDTIILKRFRRYRNPVPFEYQYIISIGDAEKRVEALSEVNYGVAFRINPGINIDKLPRGLNTRRVKTYALKYIAFSNPGRIDRKIRHIIYYATRKLDFTPSGEMIYQFVPLLSNFYSPVIEDSLENLCKKVSIKPLKKPVTLSLVHWITIKNEGEMIKNALEPYNINIKLISVNNIEEWMKKIKQADMFIITVFFDPNDIVSVWLNVFEEFVNSKRIRNYLKGVKPESFIELKKNSDRIQWMLFEEMPLIPLYNRVETMVYTNNISFETFPEQFIPFYSIKKK